MATDAIHQDRIATGLRPAAPATPLPDAVAVAKTAWTRALEACARRLELESPQAAADLVRQGNDVARMHCCQGLAEQMAESLRSSYQSIQAVFAPDCDACYEGFCLDQEASSVPLVHLLIWTDRQTPAIGLRAAALGNALAGVCRELVGIYERPSLLQARVIGDVELENLFGAGRRERWSLQLQTYLLGMGEPVEEI